MRISDAARDAMADAFATLAATGAGTAVLRIYTGSAPGSIGSAPAGTLLVEFTLVTPPLVDGGTGIVEIDGVPITEAGAASGTATYARLVNENGDAIADTEDVGTSGNEVVMSSTAVVAGNNFDLLSAVFTMPAGSV